MEFKWNQHLLAGGNTPTRHLLPPMSEMLYILLRHWPTGFHTWTQISQSIDMAIYCLLQPDFPPLLLKTLFAFFENEETNWCSTRIFTPI